MLFTYIKGHNFVWQKGTWTIQKGRWRSNSPNRKLLLTLSIEIKKKVFFSSKRARFSQASNTQMLYLSEVGPVSISFNVHKQKYLLWSNFKELYREFKVKKTAIGGLDFLNLPAYAQNGVLLLGFVTHSVCVCSIHQNDSIIKWIKIKSYIQRWQCVIHKTNTAWCNVAVIVQEGTG